VIEEEEEPKAALVIPDQPGEMKMDQLQSQDKQELQPTLAVVEIAEERPSANCKIIHLQGNPQQQQSPNVFLLADETGSSVGYIQLPSLGGPCVYGVDWPADLDVNQSDLISYLADSMAASITAHPTAQPCILGGVAFGAVLAMEVARRMPAGHVTGAILLDPSTEAADVVRTRDRLAKTRVLRQAQVTKIDFASNAVESYTFEAWSSKMKSPVVLVVPEAKNGLDKLSAWLPEAEVRLVDGVQAGGLLRFPGVSFSHVPLGDP
jgi:pimeloyl-ACP methyl ester carboxylesterase